jgi:PHYB activation tagged suppressor 1
MLTLIRVVGDRSFTGATFLVWFGPTVRLTIADPDLIRDIFTSKSEFYEKIEAHPLVKQLEGDGLLSLKGEKWAHHRKIITPTFHMENLKVSFFFFF